MLVSTLGSQGSPPGSPYDEQGSEHVFHFMDSSPDHSEINHVKHYKDISIAGTIGGLGHMVKMGSQWVRQNVS